MKNTKTLSKGFKRLLVTWQAKSKLDKPASRSGGTSASSPPHLPSSLSSRTLTRMSVV
jgi:hypothetical protein